MPLGNTGSLWTGFTAILTETGIRTGAGADVTGEGLLFEAILDPSSYTAGNLPVASRGGREGRMADRNSLHSDMNHPCRPEPIAAGSLAVHHADFLRNLNEE